MSDRFENLSRYRVSIFIFFIFQGFIFATWMPLDRGDLNTALSAVGAVPMKSPYGDYKVIASAIQYYEQGGNPYETGEFDFEGRKYNYPAYWLKFPALGLEDEQMKYMYLLFATLFSLGVMLVFWRDKSVAWYGFLPFVFSPPVFLLLERCNYEMVVFFLVVLAIWICCRNDRLSSGWVGGLLLYLATVLKVFPVFGFLVFVRGSWKRTFMFLIPFAILSAGYFAYSREYIKMVHENTPWSLYISFGINVIPNNLAEWISKDSVMLPVYLLAFAWVVAAGFIIYGYMGARQPWPIHNKLGYDAFLFRGSAAIFIAVYLMGSNFDYRLIFLIPTLPFVFRMLREDTSGKKSHVLYLVCLFLAMWVNEANLLWRLNAPVRSTIIIINELICWGLLFYCIQMQFKLLPDYLRQVIYREPVAPKVESTSSVQAD